MRKLPGAILLAVVLGMVGLGLGYALFGKLLGEYIHVKYLLNIDTNALEKAAESVIGIAAMRRKIVLCGAVGFVVGLAIRLVPGGGKSD